MTAKAGLRWPLYVLGAVCVCVSLIAIKEAVGYYGHPVAGTLVDAGGVVSTVGLPSWEGKNKGLVFPNVVLEVDGTPLVGRPGAARARVWDEKVEEAWRAGRDGVVAVVETANGERTLRLGIRPLEPEAWWIYAGALFFAAALYFAAGLIALWANERSPLVRTFSKVAVVTGLFMFSLFDFHTTRKLTVIFFAAYGMLPLAWVTLALRLPDDAAVFRRIPWLERVTDAAGMLVAASFLFLYLTGRPTIAVQQAWWPVFGGSFLFFVITLIVRFLRADGLRRARLRALLAALLPPHAGIGAIALFGALGGHNRTVGIISCVAFSLGPLSIAYAFIRHDLWGSRALLSRILTRLGVGTVVCALALGVAAALAAELGVPFEAAFLAAGLGAAAAAVLVPLALALVDRYIFPSRAKYKPTVEELSQELISITSPAEVARAVERTISRWLSCDLVELSLTDVQSRIPGPAERVEGSAKTHGTNAHPLTFRVAFGGVDLGMLRLGEKTGGALFTEDDRDLLRTIVNQGALALAHAYAYQELEHRRRQQAAAWRGERAALVETVAAELAHEIRYPINFFRNIFDNVAHGHGLDAEDVGIGREEVERLERLVASLRRMASNRLERKIVRVRDICDRIETLLRDALDERGIECAVPDFAQVRCDSDQVTQMLVNLVANGLQAAGKDGIVGISWFSDRKGAELVVWDSGPGFDGDAAKLFAPWYTTKPNGTGLGLAITHRMVRAHGWSIAASRNEGRTLFTISIRAEDVIGIREVGLDLHHGAKVA